MAKPSNTNQKLEQQKQIKILSLDPLRNQHHHFQIQNVVEEEDQESDKVHIFQPPHELFSIQNNHILYQDLPNHKKSKKHSYYFSSSSSSTISQKQNHEHEKDQESEEVHMFQQPHEPFCHNNHLLYQNPKKSKNHEKDQESAEVYIFQQPHEPFSPQNHFLCQNIVTTTQTPNPKKSKKHEKDQESQKDHILKQPHQLFCHNNHLLYQNLDNPKKSKNHGKDQESQKDHIFQQPHEPFPTQNHFLYQNIDTSQQKPTPKKTKKASHFPPLTTTKNHEKSRGKMNVGGEIVEVDGGHILRSIGRKDRHSKVCTAKGPRDRRVRLSAHTAIQFYDVQDRLGYDRPSKAVDWLIKKAKTAIDELEELPPWKPSIGPIGIQEEEQEEEDFDVDNANGSFLHSSLKDCDTYGDTIKSFFPMGGSSVGSSSGSQSQDLKLSLQSFQEETHFRESNMFGSGSTTAPLIGFDASGYWPHEQQQPAELGRMQRLLAAAAGGERVGGDYSTGFALGGGAGYLYNSPPAPPPVQQLFGQSQFFTTQRGPLQSSYSPSIRAWIDPIHNHHQDVLLPVYPASLCGTGFASEISGFSGFRIPARIQGEIEEHDGVSDKPSSVSSDSRH